MWRRALSISALVVDALMAAVLLLGVVGLSIPIAAPSGSAARPGAAIQSDDRLGALILVGSMTAVLALNVVAIVFGARLGDRRRQEVGTIASEFS